MKDRFIRLANEVTRDTGARFEIVEWTQEPQLARLPKDDEDFNVYTYAVRVKEFGRVTRTEEIKGNMAVSFDCRVLEGKED